MNLKTLQKLHPDQNWRAVRTGFNWAYENDAGDRGYHVAFLSPRFDGDDDSFTTRFVIYPKDRTQTSKEMLDTIDFIHETIQT
jgi:hypothetical protein